MVEIRRLRTADAETYRRLMIEAYALHSDAFTASVAEREDLPLQWWEQRLVDGPNADEFVIGAWDGDRLVGVAGMRREGRPKTHHKATLFGMYVHADCVRRGIGESLVVAVLEEARRRPGLRIVQLTVTDGNDTAQSLYERCGFCSFGVEPYAIAVGDGYRGKVHMWIDLAEVHGRG